jgi:hypothetical protein
VAYASEPRPTAEGEAANIDKKMNNYCSVGVDAYTPFVLFRTHTPAHAHSHLPCTSPLAADVQFATHFWLNRDECRSEFHQRVHRIFGFCPHAILIVNSSCAHLAYGLLYCQPNRI